MTVEACPTTSSILAAGRTAGSDPSWKPCLGRRPPVELHDPGRDPDCVVKLAEAPRRGRPAGSAARGHKKCPPQFRVRARVCEGGAYFLALFAAFFCFGLFFAGFLVALRAFWVFAMGKLVGMRPGLGAAEAIG